MSVSLKINKDDLARLTKKLQKLDQLLKSPEGPIRRYQVAILTDYIAVVSGAMGSVDADGGHVALEFSYGSIGTYWRPLSKMTISKKQRENASLTIWEYTGETKSSVKIYQSNSGNTYDGFAGILKSRTPSAFEHALTAEFGDVNIYDGSSWEGRALFTVANNLLLSKLPEIKEQINKRLQYTIELSKR